MWDNNDIENRHCGDIMPNSGCAIICMKSLVHQFPHEKRDPRNDSSVLNEITPELFWGMVSKVIPRGTTVETTIYYKFLERLIFI